MELNKIQSVYFVGIGGIGMSALARYFKANGFNVEGYDRTPTLLTSELESEGIGIHFEDDISLIKEEYKNPSNTLVVFTPAIPKDHQELNYFINNGFDVKKRSQVLGILTREHKGVCVAGTHGKTTISTMISHLLKQSEVDCSAFLGGVSQNYKTNLLLSETSDYVVLEADEFDRSFLQLTPYLALISSADADHLDIYGDDTSVKSSFKEFSTLVKDEGILLSKLEVDLDFESRTDVRHYTYSMNNTKADFFAENIRLDQGLYVFDLVTPNEKYQNLKLGIPALVNVENAVGACSAAILSGVKYDEIQKSLPEFKGIRRRFDIRLKTDQLILIDDYAHHPEEIKATIKSVRALYPEQRITGVFQPHLFSRTNDFHKEFAKSLSMLDELIMLDIYPARELPMEGVSSKMILDLVELDQKSISTKDNLLNEIKDLNPEVLLMMGAGDIDKEIDKITLSYQQKFKM
ncbi:UDP-N-acetylmuramate--L-alanine ligase [Plebeiibacterium sediminum]|uniref:UDP-N-acetylmuramate--L-alanine ligase n=1 Tax=Plebeiibacterium sediminum TaxID=2992112 RepID=A0AAE3M6W0_9BACT|nr:UDP-N-acetylmuramate--L-alanine ligase [Plebeiobacterium sediminum]MCW3788396.1 UDP-N-acetylmuramate--L-alanine ligase [Plebeiobacterium sediminum]